MTCDQRKQARDLEVAKQMAKLHKWAEEKSKRILKSTTIGNAIHYFINEYEELSAFLKDGRYEIDNGWIERMIRKFAIGRKNWMFSTSVEGAKASSILYSLLITAKLNGKDPFQVMTEILRRLPMAQTVDDFEALARLLVNRTSVTM